jgi:hypothetical protein
MHKINKTSLDIRSTLEILLSPGRDICVPGMLAERFATAVTFADDASTTTFGTAATRPHGASLSYKQSIQA